MIRFAFLIALIILILFVLSKRSNKSGKNSNFYKILIPTTLILGLIILLATSGRYVLPQILQFVKIGLPLMTKLLGI